jgi:hypothetical protein
MKATALGITLGLVLAACGDDAATCDGILCGACPPALELRVTSASGETPADVVVEGAALECGETVVGVVVCTAQELAVGRHELTVRAAGEAPISLTLEILADGGGCCSCGYQPVSREVAFGAADAGA